jgi:type I restriction enzyme M protein
MDQATHNRIVSFIWGIADDVLRDLFKRGKYPDVILPMCVLRRLDAVLEPTKQAVLDTKRRLDQAKIVEQDAALKAAAKQAFFNTSPFTLRDLTSRATQQALKQDFLLYLDGFSQNVQDILTNFKFRNQIDTLSADDALAPLIAEFLDPEINLSPDPVRNSDGSIRHPGVDNHSMGTIFEELVRKFNEDNNEEAGQHWTPRDAVRLMADLVFEPIKSTIRPGAYTIYDGACGTGGMMTLAEERFSTLAEENGAQVTTMLYGQEINPETYAVCKADMILKGEGEDADHIRGGAGWSTLSNDAYPAKNFDFMLSNPPYGKSWKKDHELMGGKGGIRDPRFTVKLEGEEEPVSLITRTSDGQMLFLVNMLSKMADTPQGSRIAHVHNGSSLFTGDAGQGESNVRRWIMENDWLEAIIALPLNMFYNTGIATYVWVLTNRKAEHRRGKVQLIDATEWFTPLRRNLGQKNCELSDSDIRRIVDTFLAFEPGPKSKIFPNEAFGYKKIVVERPLRLVTQLTIPAIESLRFQSSDADVREAMYEEFGQALFDDFASVREQAIAFLAAWGEDDDEDEDAVPRRKLKDKKKEKLLNASTWERDVRLYEAGLHLREKLGAGSFEDYNLVDEMAADALKGFKAKLSAAERKIILRACSERSETAPAVVAQRHKKGTAPDTYRGLFEEELGGKTVVVSYEPDTELRDTEQVPLLEPGGVQAFFEREVRPYASDAWVDEAKTKIGYEVSFTRYFYEPKTLRRLDEIAADIRRAERQAEGLLEDVLGEVA